jgi:hypothetical protein
MLLSSYCPAAVLPVSLTFLMAFFSFALLSKFFGGFDTENAAPRF